MRTHRETLKERYQNIAPFLTEKQRRIYLGNEAKLLGYGGISAVSKETRVSRRTITEGLSELSVPREFRLEKIRKTGGGRKRTKEFDHTLVEDLESLIEPVTRGHPESPLRWTCKSVRKLAAALKAKGHNTSHRMVAELLHE